MQECCVVNSDIDFRDEGEDGGILFNPATGEVKLLNECGCLIWKCLDGRHTKEDIVARLQVEFPDIERSTLEGHVSEFLTEMKQKELIGILLG